jgi:hypothetical protein
VLYLFFPGLGLVYNGELGRGTAFQGGIALLVFTIPFYAARFPARNHLIFFAATMLSSLLLWLSSPIEAFVYARRGPAATQKRYNTVPAYLAYAASSLVITALLSFVTVAFFSLEKSPTTGWRPPFAPERTVLVDRYSAKEPSAGDIVIYLHFGTQSPGRVLATGGSVIDLLTVSLPSTTFRSRMACTAMRRRGRLALTTQNCSTTKQTAGENTRYFSATTRPPLYPAMPPFASGREKFSSRQTTAPPAPSFTS